MLSLTKDAIEQGVAEAVARFHRDQHGCPPGSCSAYLVGDMLVVRSCACFTPTERQLVGSEEGRRFVKSSRRDLRSFTRRDIESHVAKAAGCAVLRSFWDLDVRNGEQVEVYVLAEDVEKRLAS